MNPYIATLLLFLFGALFVAAFVIISSLIGKGKRSAVKDQAYECGVETAGAPRENFPVKFYLVAMLFILFDIEVVFLFPWAVLFKEFVAKGEGVFIFVEMMIFLGILGVGLIYLYGRRAFEWDS